VFIDVDRRTPESPLGRIHGITLRDLRIRTRGNLLIARHAAWFRGVVGLRVRGMRTDARSGGRAAFVTDGDPESRSPV
jgi:hypothetical protein